MIKLLRTGPYHLIETLHHTKILRLGRHSYAWVEPPQIGELLVVTHRTHKTDCVLSTGMFRLYDVRDEPRYADTVHLELEAGPGVWQGYLLLTGLPDDTRPRTRIVPTPETITGNVFCRQEAI